jgi:hypothetical protein
MPSFSRRSIEVELFCEEAFTMVDNWTDQITFRSNGRSQFAVVANKFGDATSSGRRKWFEWGKVSGLKSPGDVRKAIEEQSELLGVQVELADVIAPVASVDWVTAAVIAHDAGLDLPPLPSIEALLAQRALRPLGKVVLGVTWGYEHQTLTLPFEQWVRILNEELVTISTPYWYEGKRFNSWWSFDRGAQLRVLIDMDGSGGPSGDGWIGALRNIPSIQGPKLNDADLAQLALDASKAARASSCGAPKAF